MGKPSDHGVTWSPFAAAAPAPLVGLDHLAGQYGTIRLESLPGDNEAEFVEAAEGSQVGAGERISAPADGSVVHVEVFRAECVGALILGRPRPLSGHRRAGPPRDVRYTLIWEEPDFYTESRWWAEDWVPLDWGERRLTELYQRCPVYPRTEYLFGS